MDNDYNNDYDNFEDEFSTKNRSVLDYGTYEDFLLAQATPQDRLYLECRGLTSKVAELGHMGNKTGYTLAAFLLAKENMMKKITQERKALRAPRVISAGRDFSDNMMLKMLQQREEANRTGKQSSVIMVRDRNEHGHEISGYIDYAHRLQTDDFELIFNSTKRLLPRKGDLSFMNWTKFTVYGKSSPNYELITTSCASIKFRNKRDNKIMNVDPMVKSCGLNTSRTVVHCEDYKQVIIFDHYNRTRC